MWCESWHHPQLQRILMANCRIQTQTNEIWIARKSEISHFLPQFFMWPQLWWVWQSKLWNSGPASPPEDLCKEVLGSHLYTVCRIHTFPTLVTKVEIRNPIISQFLPHGSLLTQPPLQIQQVKQKIWKRVDKQPFVQRMSEMESPHVVVHQHFFITSFSSFSFSKLFSDIPLVIHFRVCGFPIQKYFDWIFPKSGGIFFFFTK